MAHYTTFINYLSTIYACEIVQTAGYVVLDIAILPESSVNIQFAPLKIQVFQFPPTVSDDSHMLPGKQVFMIIIALPYATKYPFAKVIPPNDQ